MEISRGSDNEDRKLRQEVAVAVVALLFLLGLLGWALTLAA